MGLAFQVTTDDVENVLRTNSLYVNNSDGKPFEDMAMDLIDQIDCDRVQCVALSNSTELEEQTEAAYAEIRDILVEIGILKY
jgi:hypothetical protein